MGCMYESDQLREAAIRNGVTSGPAPEPAASSVSGSDHRRSRHACRL